MKNSLSKKSNQKSDSEGGVKFLTDKHDLVYISLTCPKAWDSRNNCFVWMNDENKDQKGLTFKKSVTILIHKDHKDILILNELINGIMPVGGVSPLKLYENSNQENLHLQYYLLTANTDPEFEVQVVNGAKEAIEDNIDRKNFIGRVFGIFKPYTVGQKGVTAYLKAIQILKPSNLSIGTKVIDVFSIEESDDEELPF